MIVERHTAAIRSAPARARDTATLAIPPFPLVWVLDTLSLLALVVARMAVPDRWRRPVRGRFMGQLDRMGVRSIAVVAVLALLMGVLLVGQGSYWLRQFGQGELVRQVLAGLLLRDLAPWMIMLVLLARGGFSLSAELVALGEGGQLHAMRAVGIDPISLLIAPTILAGVIAAVALTLLFGILAMAAGVVTAVLTGVVAFNIGLVPSQILSGVAGGALAISLSKAALMAGFGLAAMAITAVEPMTPQRRDGALARGLFRAVIGAGVIALGFGLWR